MRGDACARGLTDSAPRAGRERGSHSLVGVSAFLRGRRGFAARSPRERPVRSSRCFLGAAGAAAEAASATGGPARGRWSPGRVRPAFVPVDAVGPAGRRAVRARLSSCARVHLKRWPTRPRSSCCLRQGRAEIEHGAVALDEHHAGARVDLSRAQNEHWRLTEPSTFPR